MSKLAKKLRARRRRLKSNPGPKANPPAVGEVAEFVLPGFGGFVATKLVTRTAVSQVGKRWPKYTRHAAVAAAALSFVGAWFFANRWKWLAARHTPVVVGSGIAALQSIVQALLPDRVSWIVGDAPAANTMTAATAQQQMTQAPQQMALPAHLEDLNEDPTWYTFNDAYDKGRYNTMPSTTPAQQRAQTTTAADQPVDDFSDILDDNDTGTLAGGLMGN